VGGAEAGIELGGIAEHLDGAAIPPFPLLDAKRGYSLLFACHLPPWPCLGRRGGLGKHCRLRRQQGEWPKRDSHCYTTGHSIHCLGWKRVRC